MILSAQDINSQLLMLPTQEQLKVFDFLKNQLQAFITKEQPEETVQTEGMRILTVLENTGLLGSMEGGDGKLSENYKEHLWSNK